MSHIYQLHDCLTWDSISAASSLFSFWLENTLSSPIRILLKRELHFRLQSSENGLAEKIKHLRKDCTKVFLLLTRRESHIFTKKLQMASSEVDKICFLRAKVFNTKHIWKSVLKSITLVF